MVGVDVLSVAKLVLPDVTSVVEFPTVIEVGVFSGVVEGLVLFVEVVS